MQPQQRDQPAGGAVTLPQIAARLLHEPRPRWQHDPAYEALTIEDQGLIQLADLIAVGEDSIAELSGLPDDLVGTAVIQALACASRPRLTWLALAAVGSAAYSLDRAGELRDAYSLWLAVTEHS